MKMTKNIALVGNPNSGKTTIFNGLTGINSKTGNWPGVTVEKRENTLIGHSDINIVDLPGIYSLNIYSEDELVARDYISTNPSLIVNTVDASNMKRNLYLTVQLLEMGQNVLVAMNMIDVAKSKYERIDLEKISKALQSEVIPLSSNKGEGIKELSDSIAKDTSCKDEKFKIDYGETLESLIKDIEEEVVKRKIEYKGFDKRIIAILYLENDKDVVRLLDNEGKNKEIETKIDEIEKFYFEDVNALLIEKRYEFIQNVLTESLVKYKGIYKEKITEKVDKILLNKFAGILIFLGVMLGTFYLTFNIGGLFIGFIEKGLEGLSGIFSNIFGSESTIYSFLNDGLLGGLGTVIAALPYIIIMFLIITFLEDVGYMSRVAYLLDRVMRSIGLQGKAFIPLITGFGCTVPAIMATRTLENKNDRLATIMVVPLISCSARLPVYTLFVSALFTSYEFLVLFFIYIMGIVLAIIMAKIFKVLAFKEGDTTFMMELPSFKMPTIKASFYHTWQPVKSFLKRATTVILGIMILIWILSYLPYGVEYGSEDSIIGKIGAFIAPVFTPAGFGRYDAAAGLISGLVAKEAVVGTLSTIYGGSESSISASIAQHWTALSALAYLVMTAVYTPCFATIATIKKETNSLKWTLVAVSYTLALGYALAVIVYQVGSLLGY